MSPALQRRPCREDEDPSLNFLSENLTKLKTIQNLKLTKESFSHLLLILSLTLLLSPPANSTPGVCMARSGPVPVHGYSHADFPLELTI